MKPSEFTGRGGEAQVIFPKGDSAQVLAASGTSTAFGSDQVIRVCAYDATAWVAINSNPTAAADTAGSFPIPAGVVEYIAVEKEDKINSTAKLSIVTAK